MVPVVAARRRAPAEAQAVAGDRWRRHAIQSRFVSRTHWRAHDRRRHDRRDHDRRHRQMTGSPARILCSVNCGSRSASAATTAAILRAGPRRQGPPHQQGLHVREGAAPRPSPERPPPPTSPMRRRPDGTYEEVDWDTAVAEVAARLNDVGCRARRRAHPLLRGRRAGTTSAAATAGPPARAWPTWISNALAQEKTGEFCRRPALRPVPAATPLASGTRPRSRPSARTRGSPTASRPAPSSRRSAGDEGRPSIVIDPAAPRPPTAGRHPPPGPPGTDAWCLAAPGRRPVEEGLPPTAGARARRRPRRGHRRRGRARRRVRGRRRGRGRRAGCVRRIAGATGGVDLRGPGIQQARTPPSARTSRSCLPADRQLRPGGMNIHTCMATWPGRRRGVRLSPVTGTR